MIPLLIPITLILKFSGEGDIFYLQERIGFKNKKFYIVKFATMLRNSPNMGSGSITLKMTLELPSLVEFLRKTKINELPQIFNLLKGNISLVGPRPLVKKTFDAYSSDIQSVIYNVKPE